MFAHSEVATMTGGDTPRKTQPEAGTLAYRLRGEEGLHNVRPDGWGHSWSAVRDGDDDRVDPE